MTSPSRASALIRYQRGMDASKVSQRPLTQLTNYCLQAWIGSCLSYFHSDDPEDEHMSKRVTATEAKAKLLSLLDEVEKGEEIEITRRGAIIAKVIPTRGPQWLKDCFAGQVKILATDEELMSPVDPDAWQYD